VQGAGLGVTAVPTPSLHGARAGSMGADLVDENELRPFFPGGLEVGIVPAAGHFLHLDQPEAVHARIAGFLGPA